MNNTPVQIINLNMNKDKKELFKEIIINYLIKQITMKN
jgi:hypothetical protein